MSDVVFLHAGVADARSWPGPGATYTRSGLADPIDELFDFMDAAGLEAAVLAGNSVGGRIAIDACLERPARVRGLLLIAPGVSGAPAPTSLPAAVQALTDAIDSAEEAGRLDDVNQLEAHLWLDGASSPRGRVTGEPRARFLEMNAEALRAPTPKPERPREAAWARLDTIDVPTHVQVGELDLPHIVERARTVANSIHGATIEIVPGTAHLPTLERPAAVLHALHRVLDRMAAGH